MNDFQSIKNKIQLQIIEYLFHHGASRFRSLRPARIDSNLLSYHLTKLVHQGYIKKDGDEYQLADKGWQYVDRVLAYPSVRMQPDIKMAFVIQNDDGDVLLLQSNEAWQLPQEPAHIDDKSVTAAALGYIQSIFDNVLLLRHAGDAYLRVRRDDTQLSRTLFHVFRAEVRGATTVHNGKWVGLHSLPNYQLTPGTDAIISRSFFGDGFFFEEFTESPLY